MPGETFWQTGTAAAGGGGGGSVAPPATTNVVDSAAPGTLYVNGEEAIYDPASNRTFYAWLGSGRDLYAGHFDHTTGEASTPVLVAAATTAADDDHGAPSIVILSDGSLLIAWGTDSFGGPVQLARSTSPRDTAAWSTSSLAGDAVYPTLLVLPGGDVLLSHLDDTDVTKYVVRRSTDGGVTFGAKATLVDTTGLNAAPIAYVFPTTVTDAGLVHLSWTVGQESTSTRTDLYHAVYDPDAGTLATLDGTDLGAAVTSGEHPACLVASGTSIRNAQHTVLADGRVFCVFHLGTDDATGEEGSYTVRVSTWDGSAWSTVDTGASSPWRWALHQITTYRDGLLGLFCERTGTHTDVAAWVSPDGATWERAGAVLEGDTGEGYQRVMLPIGGGPFLAIAQQVPTDYSRDPADGMTPLVAIERPPALDGHTHDYEATGAVSTHNADAAAHAGLVQNAGRWEVVVSGNPAAAVTTGDGTDWLYTWVED